MAKTLKRQIKDARKRQREEEVCVSIRFPAELWARIVRAAKRDKISTASGWVKRIADFAADDTLKGSGRVQR